MGGIRQAREDAGKVAATDGAAKDEAPADRVFTTVDGQELDITELSIDAAYLDAPPNELRREVIMRQYIARGEQAQVQQGANNCHSQCSAVLRRHRLLQKARAAHG
jgi:E3 ubiquitin-protein ligase HUWE1